MLLQPTISAEAQTIIQQRLGDLAKYYNIKIILAIESGSRAWGFPSVNSDYDVRFVYARPAITYLSVREYRDVIETDITHETTLGVPLDLNGWDIKKALQLALKSNATLIEWLQSPIKYTGNEQIMQSLLSFAKDVGNLEAIADHYYKLALNAWKQILEQDNYFKIKLYCYALRPALAVQWARTYNDIPPMDMQTLCDGLIKNTELYEHIANLIALKTTANEQDLIAHDPSIDSFIQSALGTAPTSKKEIIREENFIKADKLFRTMIGC